MHVPVRTLNCRLWAIPGTCHRTGDTSLFNVLRDQNKIRIHGSDCTVRLPPHHNDDRLAWVASWEGSVVD